MRLLSPVILIVAGPEDSAFAAACRKVMEMDGFRVITVGSLGLAVMLACKDRVNLIVLSKSFGDIEQHAFIDCVHETHPSIHILCVRQSVSPQTLREGCNSILSADPGAAAFIHERRYRRAS